ncbi:MAG: 50S ribosomal protein L30 [Deltaproteobacteria bacterium]|nr:50S ribosomal protein L30 [Deltaproteobacteria bacterium]
MAGTIKVKWYKSWIGYNRKQRASVRGLGLRKLNDIVELKDTPAVRGMVKKISHLVRIVD